MISQASQQLGCSTGPHRDLNSPAVKFSHGQSGVEHKTKVPGQCLTVSSSAHSCVCHAAHTTLEIGLDEPLVLHLTARVACGQDILRTLSHGMALSGPPFPAHSGFRSHLHHMKMVMSQLCFGSRLPQVISGPDLPHTLELALLTWTL